MSTISKWICTCINSWKQLWSSTNFYWASKSWSLYCILPYFGIHIATSICIYVYIYMNVYAYVHMHMCIHMWIYVKTCLRVLLLNMGVLHWECCMMYGKQSAVKYGNKLDLIWFDLNRTGVSFTKVSRCVRGELWRGTSLYIRVVLI